MNLAVHLQQPLSAIDAMPFGDSLCLLAGIYEERTRRARFEAALHGAKLR